MQANRLRALLRWLHIAAGAIVGAYLYSPWGTEPAFRTAVQFALIPLLAATGVTMWQQSRLMRRLLGRPAAPARSMP